MEAMSDYSIITLESTDFLVNFIHSQKKSQVVNQLLSGTTSLL